MYKSKTTTIMMHHFNPDNEWEEDYYSRKRKSRTETTGYFFRFIFFAALAAFLVFLLSCNRQAWTAPQSEPERIACDTLIDRATGELIPIYNCGTTW